MTNAKDAPMVSIVDFPVTTPDINFESRIPIIDLSILHRRKYSADFHCIEKH